MKYFTFVAMIALSIVSTSSVNAAVIWDESIDGDLVASPNFGQLGLGSNTFSGTRTYTKTEGASSFTIDDDRFIFSLSGTQSLDSIIYSSSNFITDSNGAAVQSVYSILRDSTTFDNVWADYTYGSGGAAITNILPIIGGEYLFGEGSSICCTGNFGTASYDWTITFNTSATVPVPAAAWLFGSALIGLVGFKRKK